MRKCECIKDSKWFKIDDSFEDPDKSSSFKFKKGEHYYYIDETSEHWGKSYTVIHSPGLNASFGEIDTSRHRFIDFFKI